ncbi:DUF4007 family protein [Brevundimonas fluminis]|uniref:DUF4007 family protein n=1 Tax=Brevundimonas fluminis TaxID=2487274 RepID=UPI000F656397|nr:DUF4007 family protein [Brevundimonas fluminis]
MALSLLDIDGARLQLAGHETFPLRYGWLKKAYDAVAEVQAGADGDPVNVFADEAAIARFGVGRNMVLSMRHWSLASGILRLDESHAGRIPRILTGQLGDFLFGDSRDAHLEHPASLWLIHWSLASTPSRAGAWYWAFNEFNEPSFDRELMTQRLARRCRELQEAGRLDRAASPVVLKRDVECLVRTYHAAAATGRRAPEDSIESPLAELGLIQRAAFGDAFRFRRGPKPSLPDEVFAFALIDFWRRLHPGRKSFSVDFLTYERGSPGQVLLLDEDSVAERLSRLEALTDAGLTWDESSGMRQVYAARLDEIDPWAILARLYDRDMRLAA